MYIFEYNGIQGYKAQSTVVIDFRYRILILSISGYIICSSTDGYVRTPPFDGIALRMYKSQPSEIHEYISLFQDEIRYLVFEVRDNSKIDNVYT